MANGQIKHRSNKFNSGTYIYTIVDGFRLIYSGKFIKI